MIFTGEAIAAFLSSKGFNYLHHANTFATTRTFLGQNALLSRAEVAKRKLFQTPQGSDESDISYGIFNNIFFDVENLSARMSRTRLNRYGPIIFRYNISILNGYNVKICADNPVHFNGMSPDTWYVNDLNTIKYEGFSSWPFKNHIMLVDTPAIPLQSLEGILIYKAIVINGQDTHAILSQLDVENKINHLVQDFKTLSRPIVCEERQCTSTNSSDFTTLRNSWA